MKRKILIISYYFAPENTIGAIRFTKIAKYLIRKRYEVEIICSNSITKEDPIGVADLKQIGETHRISDNSIYALLKMHRDRIAQEKKISYNAEYNNLNQTRIIKKAVLKIIDEFLFSIIYDISFANRVKSYIRRNCHLFADIDVVVSTYNRVSGHIIGAWLKRHQKNIKWIADFRDPMVSDLTPKIFRPYYYMLEKRFCRKADAIISVAHGCISESLQKEIKHKNYIITNGYDPEDLHDIISLPKINSKLTFCYTGSLYYGKRDLSVFFEVIKELILSHQCIQDDLLVRYAGLEINQIIEQAKEYNLQGIIEYCGNIGGDKAVELQYNSDILLLASWNEKKNTDVLTGKFFEYMMSNKPIIAIVNGGIKGSKLNHMIHDMNLGICYESSNHAEDYPALKEYIIWQYKNLKKYGKVDINSDEEKINDYHYKNITCKFVEILEKI